jgi:hypothetical protein
MKPNHLKPVNDFERTLMNKVQALDSDIPIELEDSFLEKLEEITPANAPNRRRPMFLYGSIASASAVLIAVWLSIAPLFDYKIDIVEAGEVVVQDAFLEDQPANVVVVNPSDPEMTIVWLEKIDTDIDQDNSNETKTEQEYKQET